MNKVGFGFLRLPQIGEEIDWEKMYELTDYFINHGGTYFDTAYTYLDGKSEETIKKAVVERYPREQIRIADKLPSWMIKNKEECMNYFQIQCERCGVTYFDTYLLHWINEENYEIAKKQEEFLFLQQLKKEGKAKLVGFSYHDSAALLERILMEQPEIDIVQLQINYLDWESAGVEARKCYETALKYNKKIVVMEPVKGGTLASIPDEAMSCFRSINEDASAASWAIRFVQSLEQVDIVLSGMNEMEQMQDNMKDMEILSEIEKKAIKKVSEIISKKTAIPCTACKYCMGECPKKLQIPQYFRLYNEYFQKPEDDWKVKPIYEKLTKEYAKASQCIGCKRCEHHCPQHIPISQWMKKVAAALEQ